MSQPAQSTVRIDISSIAVAEGVTNKTVISIAERILKAIKYKLELNLLSKSEVPPEHNHFGFAYIRPLRVEEFTLEEILNCLNEEELYDEGSINRQEELLKHLFKRGEGEPYLERAKQILLSKAKELTVKITEEA